MKKYWKRMDQSLLHHIWYHIIYIPHITFIYYKNMQIYCINIFLILNNKIHIGFWNEEGLAESHYGFVIKPLFVNRVLRTHGWNILKVCNFIAKRKQFKFQFRFKKWKWLNFFFRILEKVIPEVIPEGPLNEILNLLLLSPVLGIL